MPRYIALLKAINVGGHTVRMEDLRSIFESLGLAKVETFIASGNVIFDSAATKVTSLEQRIARRLQDELGYEVPTFVRTAAELAAIAGYQPFRPADLAVAQALNVAFLSEEADEAAKRKVMACKTAIDAFHIHGRELYWLCRKRQSDSTFSNAVLEKALGRPSTIRGMSTVKKMAAKYPAPSK